MENFKKVLPFGRPFFHSPNRSTHHKKVQMLLSLQFDHTNTANRLAEVLVLLTTAEGRLNVFYNLNMYLRPSV
jgi:hypothetical protein